MLGTQPRSSSRSASALNCSRPPPPPSQGFDPACHYLSQVITVWCLLPSFLSTLCSGFQSLPPTPSPTPTLVLLLPVAPSVFRGLWNHISKASISPKALGSGDCWPARDPLLPLRQQQPQWLGGGGCYGGMFPQKAAPQEGGDTLPSGAASEVEEDSLIFYSSSSRDLYLHGTVGLK